jgi:hypothetical protein
MHHRFAFFVPNQAYDRFGVRAERRYESLGADQGGTRNHQGPARTRFHHRPYYNDAGSLHHMGRGRRVLALAYQGSWIGQDHPASLPF